MNSMIYFVADVHLERRNLQKRNLFLAFVEMVKERGGDLFILGDLFDYWANNRSVMRKHQAVLNALYELTQNGSKVGFLIGNRDLLLGKKVLLRYGVDYLGESSKLKLQGKSLFLTHGHLLYTDDVNFQRYRKTKWPIYRMLDRVLPGFIENALAKRFILKSKQVIDTQESWRLQFSEETIDEIFHQGVEAGKIAREILQDGRSPSEIPITATVRGEPAISLARANKLGIRIKSSLLLTADVVGKFYWDQERCFSVSGKKSY